MRNSQKVIEADDHALLSSVERGEWKSAGSGESSRIKSLFGLSLRKDARVNIRMPSQDLTALQQRAAREGIPYQTLLASLVHKFVTRQIQFAPEASFVDPIK